MKKIDSISKIAAIFLILIFQAPTLIASTNVILHGIKVQSNRSITQSRKVLLQGSGIADVNTEVVFRKNAIKERDKTTSLVVPSIDNEIGYIGLSVNDPIGSPENDVFHFILKDDKYKEFNYVALSYEVRGVANGNQLSKRWNDGQVFGSLNYVNSEEWVETLEPLSIDQCVDGLNVLKFTSPINSYVKAEIKNVELVFSNEPFVDLKQVVHKEVLEEDIFNAVYIGSGNVKAYQEWDIQVPSIPRNIINVTKGAYAYKFRGLNGESKDLIGIGIDLERLPAGYSASDVVTYYFNDVLKSWVPVTIDSCYESNFGGEKHNQNGDGTAMNFVPAQSGSEYFNGLIKGPEMPDASAFVPTQMKDIQAANPAEGITIMQAPTANRSGDANLTYPFAIPAGRNGMTPKLGLSYSSSGGSGWLGLGWDINIPSISVDTRWGVPLFPSNYQAEVYLLNGNSLSMEGGKKGNRVDIPNSDLNLAARKTGVVRFFERTYNGYQKIERYGNTPSQYSWVVTDAEGTKYYYGTINGGTSVDSQSVLRENTTSPILKWYLRKVIDKWGNFIEYEYSKTTIPSSKKPFNDAQEIYVSRIKYTGFNTESGNYSIDFVLYNDPNFRSDAMTSYSTGVKTADTKKLHYLSIKYQYNEVSRYTFNYDNGDFGKTILKEIVEERNGISYSHVLEYYANTLEMEDNHVLINADQTSNFDLFEENGVLDYVQDITNSLVGVTGTGVPRDFSNLGSTFGVGYSFGGNGGIGWEPIIFNNKANTVSAGINYSKNYTYGRRMLTDLNGDGIPDLFIQRPDNGIKVKTITYSPETNYSISNNTSVGGGLSRYLQSESEAFGWSAELQAAITSFSAFAGYNNTKTKAWDNVYLVDYNADGLVDIVDHGTVYFNQYETSSSSINFGVESTETPNPVIYGGPISEYVDNDDLKTQEEVVRTWRAPFDGEITLNSVASVSAYSNDGAKVAIQHKSGYLSGVNFTTLSPNQSNSRNETVNVSRGDLLMFRSRTNVNGYKDKVSWNPSIDYSGNHIVDPNGVDFHASSAADGFLLSGHQVAEIGDDDYGFEIEWANLSVAGQTDSVNFIIKLTHSAGETYFRKSFGPQQSIVLNSSTTFDYYKGYYIASISYSNYYNSPGIACEFSVVSSSNIDWPAIEWRPKVIRHYNNGQSNLTSDIYPVVFKKAYNDPYKVQGYFELYNYLSGFVGWKVMPDVLNGFYNLVFPNSSANIKHAQLVVKYEGMPIQKYNLTTDVNNTLNIENANDLASPENSPVYCSSVMLSSEEYAEFPIWVGIYTDNDTMAEALSNYMKVSLYGTGDFENCEPIGEVPYNVLLHKPNLTGPDFRGWGQFLWFTNSETAILVSDISITELPSGTLDFENLPSPPSVSDIQQAGQDAGYIDGATKFNVMFPQRGENVNGSYFNLFGTVGTSQLDRFIGKDPYSAVYVNAQQPNRFGDKPSDIEEAYTPPSLTSNYKAVAPTRYNKSYAQSTAFGGSWESSSMGASSSKSYSIPNTNYSEGRRGFIDVNGDRYPDVLEIYDSPGSLASFQSNPLGGFGGVATTMDLGGQSYKFSESVSENEALTLGGQYISSEGKKKSSFGGALSDSYGTSKVLIQMIDLNGDGINDRVFSNGTAQLGTGNGFESVYVLSINTEQVSSNNSESLSGSKGYSNDYNSVGGGVGFNRTTSELNGFFVDLNGDGLPDFVNQNGDYYINQGGIFASVINEETLDETNLRELFSASMNISGTLAFDVSKAKVSATATSSGYLCQNNSNNILIDMNGDGYVDRVETDFFNGDDIKIYHSKLKKVNLLKEIKNPLGGVISLEYDRVGNKYGYYNRTIFNHLYKPFEQEPQVFWDMQSSKWVLSEVRINDGYDLQSTTLGDVDGYDEFTTTFQYDGGIFSRREREFKGFTRVATISPVNAEESAKRILDLEDGNGTSDTSYFNDHLISIVDYYNPESADYYDRIQSEYLDGQVLNTYTVLQYDKYFLEGETPNVFTRHKLVSWGKSFYSVYNVDLNPASSNFGLLDFSGETNMATLNESSSLFIRLDSARTYTFPNMESEFFATKLEFYYDKFGNVKRVQDWGQDEVLPATYQLAGHYVLGEEPTEYDLYKLDFPVSFKVGIIALMDYFPLNQTSGRSGVLKRHRVFINDTVNMSNLKSLAWVDQLTANGLATEVIQNASAISASIQTDLTYDTYGNVTQVLGGLNHAGQRAYTNYTYDNVDHQFVNQITNVYGDQVCNTYDHGTGNLLQTIDPNGFLTRYEYDDFYRVNKIIANREFENSQAPYTIEFSYFPKGRFSEGSVANYDFETIPVALTNHYIGSQGNSQVLGESEQSSYECGTLYSKEISGEEDYSSLLKTYTFIDGLGRTVQVKKQSTKTVENSGSYIDNQVLTVSGVEELRANGSSVRSRLPVIEVLASSPSLDNFKLNENYSAVVTSVSDIDLLGRVNKLQAIADDGTLQLVNTSRFYWKVNQNNKLDFVVQNTGVSNSLEYYNVRNQMVRSDVDFGDPNDNITTNYNYNAYGQLLNVVNPIGLTTTYQYDLLNRVIYENQPDRGITTSTFDNAGNARTITVNGPASSGTATLTLNYNYNRLSEKVYPLSSALNNTYYSYGSGGDGVNGAGRIVKVEQGNNGSSGRILKDEFHYDGLGNQIYQKRTIAIPGKGNVPFVTKWMYDSWGRIEKMKYPEGELLSYSYHSGGELNSIETDEPMITYGAGSYISQLGYDGFGNNSLMIYGNGSKMVKTYNSNTFRTNNVSVFSGVHNQVDQSVQLLNKQFVFNEFGQITSIANSAQGVSSVGSLNNVLGGTYTNSYTYDLANRLSTSSSNSNIGGASYSYGVTMQYDPSGRIEMKNQTHTMGGTGTIHQYNNNYIYGNTSNHQLTQFNSSEYFTYNNRGSLSRRYTVMETVVDTIEKLVWDESDRLRGVANSTGFHHYVYDYNGQRLMKSSYSDIVASQNSNPTTASVYDPYVVYVGPHYVTVPYAKNYFEVTKHYYQGVTKIASRPLTLRDQMSIEQDINGNPIWTNAHDEYIVLTDGIFAPVGNTSALILNDAKDAINKLHVNAVTSGISSQTLSNYTWGAMTAFCYGQQGTPTDFEYEICNCETDRFHVNIGVNCLNYRPVYWYHPDYLGNVEFVSDLTGMPYQFFQYSPWGEVLVEQTHAGDDFSTPYRFNGKEIDPETGFHYYGARYYEDQRSVWLSVDPQDFKERNITPYAFVGNNPIGFIDPDGRYRFPADFKENYPLLYEQIGGDKLYNYVTSHPRIIEGLIKFGRPLSNGATYFTPDRLRKIFMEQKNSPLLKVRDFGALEWHDFANTTPQGNVNIDKGFLDEIESILKSKLSTEIKQAAVLRVMITLIHEPIHMSEYHQNGPGPNGAEKGIEMTEYVFGLQENTNYSDPDFTYSDTRYSFINYHSLRPKEYTPEVVREYFQNLINNGQGSLIPGENE